MHIKELAIHNIYTNEETSRIKLETPMTILTGYNGSGKTTLLEIIHSTFSLLSDQEYIFPRSNWGCEITLADSTKIFHSKIGRPVKENFRPPTLHSLNEANKHNSLKKFYDQIIADTIDIGKLTNTIVKKEGDGRQSQATNIVNIVRNTKNEEIDTTTILYRDEIFLSKEENNEAQKLEDLDVFSKNKNLDKTLLILLKDFSSELADTDSSKTISDQLKEILDLIKTEKKKNAKELFDQIEKLKKINFNEDDSNAFLDEANIFFRTTHRKLVVSDKKLLSLKTDRGLTQWYDFSKGEKTLLCLLLAAYLNRNQSKIFLLDEPDLSLHINWQKQLLPSLQKLSPNSQFIVATHSPALIGRCSNEKIINISTLKRT